MSYPHNPMNSNPPQSVVQNTVSQPPVMAYVPQQPPKSNRNGVVIAVIITLSVVAVVSILFACVCLIFATRGTAGDNGVLDGVYDETSDIGFESDKFDRIEGRSYFIQSAAVPDLVEDRLTAVVTEVYYTRGGYLCVKMILGNGSDEDKGVNSLTVSVSNGNEQLIAAGYTDAISDDYVVKAGDYNEYTFYVSPEYVEIKDDPLTTIYYSVTVE